ncbi:cytochrome P450 [Nocardia brasiliensis]|uniref:cytochrome P450 n=1 Tax=Nocardia brasiliensis TaxID=37326 RepID=UPI00189575A3|nr:cytochrome P450 [Nocardia brasiliensis]MBF6125611.1 cytochrome P450 [Nocardia brasiliensis]
MKDLSSIPAAPAALPLIGHLIPLCRDPLKFMNSLPVHGDLVRIRLGSHTMVVICTSEMTREVLVRDKVFDKGGPVWERTREFMGGNSILNASHDSHRRLRHLAQPVFHPSRLPGYARTMSSCIESAINSWFPGQKLDVPTEMMGITAKVSIAALFSDALTATEYEQIVEDVRTFFYWVYRRTLVATFSTPLPMPRSRSCEQARSRLFRCCGQIVARRLADHADHGDLLSALVCTHAAAADGRQRFDDVDVCGTLVAFLLGGTETTAATLAWALHLLARHTEIEQQLHSETDTVLGGRTATYADLPRLRLTTRIITETLRLYSPAWFLTRIVTTDTRLGGHLLPAGTTVVYSPYLIHHRPDLYTDPEAFDPGRWEPQRLQPPRHAILPFSAGARKCIGDTFGMTEATLTLASIAARWRLEHVPGQKVRAGLSATLQPQNLHMYAIPRSRRSSNRRSP